MDDSEKPELAKGPDGSIDIESELKSIERFRNIGMDTEGMEDLLFNDIDSYKLKKLDMIHRELYGDFRESEGYNKPSIPQYEDISYDPDQQEGISTGEEDQQGSQVYDEDEELLLLGSPIDEEDHQTGMESVDISGSGAPVNENKSIDEIKDPSDMDIEPYTDEEASYKSKPHEVHPTRDKQIENKKQKFIPISHRILIPVVSIIVIILLIGAYIQLSPLDNDTKTERQLNAYFSISDLNPEAADIVSFSSDNIEPEIEYKWKIQPEGFKITEGKLDRGSFSGFFMKDGIYEIELEVSKGTEIMNQFREINVQKRDITLARENYADNSRFHVNGNVRIDRLYNSIDINEMISYSTLDAEFWTEEGKPMEINIDEEKTRQFTGLSKRNYAMKRMTKQDLKISGFLKSETGARQPTITGQTSLEQESYTDLYSKQPIMVYSDLAYDLKIQPIGGKQIDIDQNERIWTYPSMGKEIYDLRIEDISPLRNISIEDEGITKWGSYDLNWFASSYDRIMETPCLRLILSLSPSTMDRLSLKDFELDIWIGDNIPQMMNMVLNVSSKRNIQTPYILNYHQKITDHTDGEEPVIYEDIEYQHNIVDNIAEVFPDLSDDFHDNWQTVPQRGEGFSSIPSDFSAENAVDSFENTPNYRNFERTRTDPYGVYTNFTKNLGIEQWRFSIAEKGDDRGWNQTVTRETNPPGLVSKIDQVMLDRDDIGSVLTYSGSELAMKRLMNAINPDGNKALFGVREVQDERYIDMDKNSLETIADMEYPMLGLIDPSISERVPYGLKVLSKDGKVEIGLDMTTGQLAYCRIVS